MKKFERFHIYTPSGNIEYSSDGIFLYYNDVIDVVETCMHVQENNEHLKEENKHLKSMVEILNQKIEALEK